MSTSMQTVLDQVRAERETQHYAELTLVVAAVQLARDMAERYADRHTSFADESFCRCRGCQLANATSRGGAGGHVERRVLPLLDVALTQINGEVAEHLDGDNACEDYKRLGAMLRQSEKLLTKERDAAGKVIPWQADEPATVEG